MVSISKAILPLHIDEFDLQPLSQVLSALRTLSISWAPSREDKANLTPYHRCSSEPFRIGCHVEHGAQAAIVKPRSVAELQGGWGT